MRNYYFIILLSFISCKQTIKDDSVVANKMPFIKLHDDFQSDTTILFNIVSPTTNSISLKYIGLQTDTITINKLKSIDGIKPPPPPTKSKIRVKTKKEPFDEFLVESYNNLYNIVDTKNVLIFIDTSQTIEQFQLGMYNLSDSEKLKEKDFSFFAYPIFIFNNSIDTITLGAPRGNLLLTLQAKDFNGNWIDIEKKYFIGCGFGLNDAFLPSSYFAVATMLKYNGDYETEFRVKYLDIYSNYIHGRVSKKLLIKMVEFNKLNNRN